MTIATETKTEPSYNVLLQATEPRDCETCKGVGTLFREGFTALDGTVYPAETKTCYRCHGEKQWHPPDFAKILSQITTGRGVKDGKRKLLASFPSKKLNHYSDREAGRAYYVWRLARFHGGIDMTMPMTATMVNGGDPFHKELDKFSEVVAKANFGTDMAAATRWGQAFGII